MTASESKREFLEQGVLSQRARRLLGAAAVSIALIAPTAIGATVASATVSTSGPNPQATYPLWIPSGGATLIRGAGSDTTFFMIEKILRPLQLGRPLRLHA